MATQDDARGGDGSGGANPRGGSGVYGGTATATPPVAPVHHPTIMPCQCHTKHWVAFSIVRCSNSVIRLFGRNDFHRFLATFFSFLTVVFVLASGGVLLSKSAFRYLLSTGIIAALYSLVQLTVGIWEIAIRDCLPTWKSDGVSRYGTFMFDLALAYLLLSSSSVTVLGANSSFGPYYWREPNRAMARCSVAWSFFTFFFVAMSSLFSGYKLFKRIIWSSSSNELDDANRSAAETPAEDDADGSCGGCASPGGGEGSSGALESAGSPAPTVLTIGDVQGSPPHSAAPVRYTRLSTCQSHTNYLAAALPVHHYSNDVLQLFKRDEVRRSLATFFSFATIACVLASRFLRIPAFRYVFSTGILAFLYSSIQLTERIWKTASKSYISLPDNVSCAGTFIIDLIWSYLLLSSSSVGVLILDNDDYNRGNSIRTLAIVSIVWSFVTFFFLAMSSLFSGYKLCKRIASPSVSAEFGDADKSWTDPLLAA